MGVLRIRFKFGILVTNNAYQLFCHTPSSAEASASWYQAAGATFPFDDVPDDEQTQQVFGTFITPGATVGNCFSRWPAWRGCYEDAEDLLCLLIVWNIIEWERGARGLVYQLADAPRHWMSWYPWPREIPMENYS